MKLKNILKMLKIEPATQMMPDFAIAEDSTINTLEILKKLWFNSIKVFFYQFSQKIIPIRRKRSHPYDRHLPLSRSRLLLLGYVG